MIQRIFWVMVLFSVWFIGSVSRGDEPKEKPRQSSNPPAFLVKPYLQLPTPTSMKILWETDQELPGRVEYGITHDLDHVAEASKGCTLHEIALTDLQPATSYYYRVRSGDLTSETYRFKTAPPPGSKRWRLAVYGDSRSDPATHRKVVEQIAKAKVDLIVHTGDIVANGKNHESWRSEFFEPLEPLAHSVPWVSTIGNHERDSEHYFSYMALPGNEHYFGLDYANAHIIGLDSNAWIEKGRDSPQYQWLVEDLRARRAAKPTWTLVAFHHPLFSAHATRPISPLRWDWAPLFLDTENQVDVVLTGHDHFYARNYRMSRLATQPQPGVLFLTTAGGGASLYRTKARDYVAKEKSVHHFTLFEFDGDKAAVSAIDLRGVVLDRFTLSKDVTAPQEFCAYEIEELRHFLRLALSSAAVMPSHAEELTKIDTTLHLPTRFRVPVAGRLTWRPAEGWNLKQLEIQFQLQPGQALDIPLQAEVQPGPFASLPALTIAFEPGRFRNRTIELYPFKLAGPEAVLVGTAKKPPAIDGKLDDDCWRVAGSEAKTPGTYPLLALPPGGGRGDRVQFFIDRDWLYFGARLDDPQDRVSVKPVDTRSDPSRLVLFNEHVRLLLWDGTQTRSFAISPEQVRYGAIGQQQDKTTVWHAAASRGTGCWCVEMAIPRNLLPDLSRARINVVHRRGQGKDVVDCELCPTYGMGDDADRLPDWKPTDNAARSARLLTEKE